MNTPTQKVVGDLIAHWRREPTEKDKAEIRNIVLGAVLENGIKCSVDFEIYRHVASLGFGGIRATINLKEPVNGHRDWSGTLYKGITKISVDFDRCAGLYSYEDACKRQEVEDNIAKECVGYNEKARLAIDALPWDAESLDFSARTDGKERAYRKHHWYICEGKNHYGYDSTYAGLGEQFKAYLADLSAALGIYNPAIAYPPEEEWKVA